MSKYQRNIKSMERYEEKLENAGDKRVHIRFKKEVIESLELYQNENNFNSLNDTIASLIPEKYFKKD